MKNNLSVSIGIPAFNEGANISYLLDSLLAQKNRGFKIKEILVISDGSSDDTVRFARTVKDKRIVVIDGKTRLGKSARLQTIFRKFQGDVLFLMDADIAITDNFLFSKIIRRANIKKAGIVSVNATPLPAESVFEKIIEVGVSVMKDIRRTWRNGHNYLPYKGCFLVLHNDLVKKTRIPAEVVSNDSYLYFNALVNGFTPRYLDSVVIYYRSPKSISDHNKQASRFVSSKAEMARYFDLDWNHEYTIPYRTLVASVVKALVIQPIWTSAYLSITLLGRVKKQPAVSSRWSVANSTKRVLYYG